MSNFTFDQITESLDRYKKTLIEENALTPEINGVNKMTKMVAESQIRQGVDSIKQWLFEDLER